MIQAAAKTPVLETARLTLRAFAPQDMEAGVDFLMQPRTRYMGGPFSRAAAWDHCAVQIGHWAIRGYGLFTICLKGTDEAIGDAGLICPGGYHEPELGWGLWSPAHEGQGFAHEAALAVRAHAYRDLGWSTLISYIDPDNARSIALAKRLGCTLDSDAKLPDLPDWEGTLTFRHPGPEALA
ncbi:N-acetyltransferase [Roseovarius faecimaris]|uniref:N-acetyltransferase n=1 Tax=Roseovarius faecimaris TaxID=2494550 RepID=A0A6I6J4C9_9RHOB|nr:GNAT family N-acetyltransferase [Roseovarius faecimaris]QGX99618.1 N-acetyltransferase [Roseovarius faecimaris]